MGIEMERDQGSEREKVQDVFYKLGPVLQIEAINITRGITAADSKFDGNEGNFILLDDIINEVGVDKHVSQLFTKRQYHNLSVIYLN